MTKEQLLEYLFDKINTNDIDMDTMQIGAGKITIHNEEKDVVFEIMVKEK